MFALAWAHRTPPGRPWEGRVPSGRHQQALFQLASTAPELPQITEPSISPKLVAFSNQLFLIVQRPIIGIAGMLARLFRCTRPQTTLGSRRSEAIRRSEPCGPGEQSSVRSVPSSRSSTPCWPNGRGSFSPIPGNGSRLVHGPRRRARSCRSQANPRRPRYQLHRESGAGHGRWCSRDSCSLSAPPREVFSARSARHRPERGSSFVVRRCGLPGSKGVLLARRRPAGGGWLGSPGRRMSSESRRESTPRE